MSAESPAVGTESVHELARRLCEQVASYGSAVVALSGGVDSAVVAKAARLALGSRGMAVIGVGPAVAESELTFARATASAIGISLREIPTAEIERAGYVENAPNRCYHCKTELYGVLDGVRQSLGFAVIANGTNADDLGDYRPGLMAATEHAVRSPLAELGMGKELVRQLARHWQLAVSEKPASPCLASRIAYGQPVTPERLARIEAAERYLRELELPDCRVRLHAGEMARIEVPIERIPQLAGASTRPGIVARLLALGFRRVTLDLGGLESGSLNQMVDPTDLVQLDIQR